MKSFLFYDTETSGFNHAFDQILAFAAIRTDLNLREIERHSITIQLRKDVIPAIDAFLTHGLTFQELCKGLCEYDAAFQIHKLVNMPGTISLGYNTLGFDDEFLRFLFYRNLLDPYTHQYSNGCSRADILPIAVIFRTFHPVGIKWPVLDGVPSLKLEFISRENKFKVSGHAHDAMSDVEAVIELCHKFMKEKAIWNYCLDFFNKMRDEVRINDINNTFSVEKKQFKLCLMASASFGPESNYIAPVIDIGPSLQYKKQRLWMRLDQDNILGLDQGDNLEDTFVIRKRPADQHIILPPLDRFWEKVSKPSLEAVKRNSAVLKENQKRFFEFIAYHRQYKYPAIESLDPDAALYQEGFFSRSEELERKRFHAALKNTLANKHDQIQLDEFENPRVKKLASRILQRNFHDISMVPMDGEFEGHLKCLKKSEPQNPVVGYKNEEKLNLRQGMALIKQKEENMTLLGEREKRILSEVKNYLNGL